MREECTVDRFLKDVASHRLTVTRDEGVFRHLRFQKPGSGCYSFDIITWDGYLCYTGDMGCYVFSRITDMLEFFRSPNDVELKINLHYWAEKIQAADQTDGLKEYSPDKARQVVADILDQDEDADDDLRAAVSDYVLARADDGPQAVHDAAESFEWNGSPYFSDFWEYDLTEYTYRFIWCCYALVWGIQQYDKLKLEKEKQSDANKAG